MPRGNVTPAAHGGWSCGLEDRTGRRSETPSRSVLLHLALATTVLHLDATRTGSSRHASLLYPGLGAGEHFL